jgi:hypothetical protein
MHFLIIGAAAMTGRKPTERLSKDGALLGRSIDTLTLTNVFPATAPPASAATEVVTDHLASPDAVATKRCRTLERRTAITANLRSGCRGMDLHSHIRCPHPTTPAAELAIWQASLYLAPE